jgi:hypothetical protein
MKKLTNYLFRISVIGFVLITNIKTAFCQLEAEAYINNNVSCFGRSDGSATITAAGGVVPYTYLWSDANSQTTATATGLSVGAYTVTVTDALHSTATATINIIQPSQLVSTIASFTNVTCRGNSNGSATLSTMGGTPPYSYNWIPYGGSAPSATGLTNINYTVLVMDANGCAVNKIVPIGSRSNLQFDDSVTNVSCYGALNGVAKHSSGAV